MRASAQSGLSNSGQAAEGTPASAGQTRRAAGSPWLLTGSGTVGVVFEQLGRTEARVPIVGVLQSPNLTQERYEESIHMLTAADSISSADDFPFDGQLAHLVVQSAAGFRICRRVGVRGSSSSAGERLMPVRS